MPPLGDGLDVDVHAEIQAEVVGYAYLGEGLLVLTVDVVAGVVIEDSVKLIVVLEVESMGQRGHLQRVVGPDAGFAIRDFPGFLGQIYPT